MALNVISVKNASNLELELFKNYFLDSVEELVNRYRESITDFDVSNTVSQMSTKAMDRIMNFGLLAVPLLFILD